MRLCTTEGCDRKIYAKGLCKKHHSKAWRIANPEKIKGYKTQEYAVNKVRVLASARRRYLENPAYEMWKASRARAKRYGIPFNLEVSDIIIPKYCPILGITLSVIHDMKNRDSSPSLDRIIPALGYVKGNLAVISVRANRIKNNATLEEITMLKVWLEKQIP